MARFEESIKKILINEGGYVNDPDDPGGETNYGISKRQYPDMDIKQLSWAQAVEIYKADYWDRIKGADIVNQEMADQLFDFAVNAGISQSVKILQNIIEVDEDGIMGNVTLDRLNAALYRDSAFWVWRFKEQRIKYYLKIARNKTKRKFLYAWIKRVME